MGQPTSKLPLPVDWFPNPTTCLIPAPIQPTCTIPNRIHTRSAVFPQCTGQTHRPTDGYRESSTTIGRFHSIQWRRLKIGRLPQNKTAILNNMHARNIHNCIDLFQPVYGHQRTGWRFCMWPQSSLGDAIQMPQLQLIVAGTYLRSRVVVKK